MGKVRIKRVKKTSRAALEKKLDLAWSEYVRNRDKVCQKCHGFGSISAHHAFGRRHRATRWDVMNGVGMCYPCHINWAHRDPSGFSVWFEKLVGEATFKRLSEAHNMPVKHTLEELREMLLFFENLA